MAKVGGVERLFFFANKESVVREAPSKVAEMLGVLP
jgi:hypothetical protein